MQAFSVLDFREQLGAESEEPCEGIKHRNDGGYDDYHAQIRLPIEWSFLQKRGDKSRNENDNGINGHARDERRNAFLASVEHGGEVFKLSHLLSVFKFVVRA